MATDNTPRIVTALGYAGRVYRAGQEKELAAAAKAGGLDLSSFVTEEDGDERPLAGDWSASPARRSAAAEETVYVDGVTFASDAAGEAAKAAGLTAADFEGVTASGQDGYTKPDVNKVLAAKEGK